MKFFRSLEPDWKFFFKSLSRSELAEFETRLLTQGLYVGEYMELVEESFLRESRSLDFKRYLRHDGGSGQSLVLAERIVASYSANKEAFWAVGPLKHDRRLPESPEVAAEMIPDCAVDSTRNAQRHLRIRVHNHIRIRDIVLGRTS